MVSYGYDPYYDILRLSYPDIKGHEMTSICWFGGIKLKIGRNKSSCQKTIERIFSMLTTSRKDEIRFLGITYKIFGIEVRDNLNNLIIYDTFKKKSDTFFDPREHGLFIMNELICDAGKGYHCSFYVKYNRLILEKFYIRRKPVWWGQSKRSANLFIPYTGGLIIGEENRPQKMLDLKFSGGTLTGATDLTRKLKAIKEAADVIQKNNEGRPPRINTSERSDIYRAIAKNTFSDEYKRIGVGRLLWDEMHKAH